jgi:hypothetical protein
MVFVFTLFVVGFLHSGFGVIAAPSMRDPEYEPRPNP